MPKIVARALSILVQVCAVGFAASVGYFIYLSRHSPASPIASTGQTVQLNNHGALFYVSFWNAILAQSSLAFVATAFMGVLLLKRRYKEIPEPELPRATGYIASALLAAVMIYMFWPLF